MAKTSHSTDAPPGRLDSCFSKTFRERESILNLVQPKEIKNSSSEGNFSGTKNGPSGRMGAIHLPERDYICSEPASPNNSSQDFQPFTALRCTSSTNNNQSVAKTSSFSSIESVGSQPLRDPVSTRLKASISISEPNSSCASPPTSQPNYNINSSLSASVAISQQAETIESNKVNVDSNFTIDSDNCSNNSIIPLPSQSWIHCFCEVRFDLETGQAVDQIFPPYSLSPSEIKNIAFASFPDNRVFETGDMVYSFRIRKSSTQPGPSPSNSRAESPTPSSELEPIVPDSDFYTGYVYFRQRRDPRVHRGYYQKSLVLLTSLPSSSTVGLFTHLITLVGGRYHDFVGKNESKKSSGYVAAEVFLESALQDLSRWPGPCYGTTLEVPLAGTVLQLELPDHPHRGLQLLETARVVSQDETHLLASVPDGSSPGLLLHWWDRLTDLWTMWELVLLGEPLVVMAPDPATCSHVVLELLDLIKPIPYCGDFRPYLTIQDPDHKSFTNKRRVPTSTILGVTNPYFGEALAHWPHWIHLGSPSTSTGTTRSKPGFLDNFQFPTSSTNQTNRCRSRRGRGITTSHKSFITKDRNLIHHLTTSMLRGDRSATVLNNKLRRYFGELTERFLAPLNRYVSTLVPTQWTGVQGKPPVLRPFKTNDFLKSLEEHGVGTSSPHTEWGCDLYRQFLLSGNFATWLQARTHQSELELRKRHVAQLCDLDIGKWIANHSEVEVIDLVLKLREEIASLPPHEIPLKSSHSHSISVPSSSPRLAGYQHRHHTSTPPLYSLHREQLTEQVDRILFLLPPDLQAIFQRP